ncbi:hypothetical protein GJ744_006289 [Endocarpon pusillum]|uniref:rRNA biogenesis protein RRP36 n=1 Tax=Endocarpon pusillum TaxID=364733 RepID=A0A8H7DWS9_9EURO|nr:hypothetical protein GJ744_006289 [Endocarpon pusillum]
MSRERLLKRTVRARRNEEAEYGSSLSENEDQDVAQGHTSDSEESSNDTATTVSKEDPDISDDEEEEETVSSLKDISFGALAKAQAKAQESLAPPPLRPGKRKHTTDTEPDASNSAPKEEGTPTASRPTKFFKPSHHRTSKHAPQTLSTRHAVPRKRSIIEPSAGLKWRDPRFDPTNLRPSTTSRAAESERADKNYSFLLSYRQSELQTLQAQLKAAQNPLPPSSRKKRKKGTTSAAAPAPPPPASDPETIASLKRQIMSLTSKLANSEAKTREREILRAHRAKEREAIREGRKTQPYYLKKGEVRKEIAKEKFEGLGRRAKEKKEERRRKREKGREGRGLPRVRRERDVATSQR